MTTSGRIFTTLLLAGASLLFPPIATVQADMACMECHVDPLDPGSGIHGGFIAEWASGDLVDTMCLACHNGSYISPNGDPAREVLYHEEAGTSNRANCRDCHAHIPVPDLPMVMVDPAVANGAHPHTVAPTANTVVTGVNTNPVYGVSGIDASGVAIAAVDNQYEVCFKCHGVPGEGACLTGQRCSTATGLLHDAP